MGRKSAFEKNNPGGFQYDDKKHMEWFIAMLLPHLWVPLGQQTIETQDKAPEVAIKLEARWRDDSQLDVRKIRGQLEAMHKEIQNLRKE